MRRGSAAARHDDMLPEAIALDVVARGRRADRASTSRQASSCIPAPATGPARSPNALLHHAPQLAAVPRAGIVHRLDKDTSGLMVVAKTLTAHTALVRQLQARTVTREYLALAARRHRARRHGRRADRPPSDATHDDGRRRYAASRRARISTSSSASAARRCFAAGSKPGARTRSACTSHRSVTRSSAIPRTAAQGTDCVCAPGAARGTPWRSSTRSRDRGARGIRRCRMTSCRSCASLRAHANSMKRLRRPPCSPMRSPMRASTGSCPSGPRPTTCRALATTRNGGVSIGARASMNLGRNVRDDAARARGESPPARAVPAGGTDAGSHQVHGTAVATLTAESRDGQRPVADAAVTRERGRRLRGAHRRLPAGAVRRSPEQGRRRRARGLARTRAQACSKRRSRRCAAQVPGRTTSSRGSAPRSVRRVSKSAPMSATAFCADDGDAKPGSRRTRPGKWLADLYGLARARLARSGVRARRAAAVIARTTTRRASSRIAASATRAGWRRCVWLATADG